MIATENVNKEYAKVSVHVSSGFSEGMDKLYQAMGFGDQEKTLFLILNLGMNYIIQISKLKLDYIPSFFSRKDIRDTTYQNTIMKLLFLGKAFQVLI